jgi:aldehyde:ferredoxin oxidoreductase
MDVCGYAGRELYVDLTTGTIEEKTLDLDQAVKFLGGMGLQLRILYDLLRPGTDPFSPDNPIIIGSGPLTGTNAPGTPRIMATLKYPETGAIGAGGGAMNPGFMLKLAGYDHVVITGKAPNPVYIKVIDKDVEIVDARAIWGKDIVEATEYLWGRHGDCGVIAIGQAGEHSSRIAQATCDLGSSMGRGGFGGVMGSKNLKAFVAKGSGSIKIADPARFGKTVESMFARVKRYPLHGNIVRYGVMENWPNYMRQLQHSRCRSLLPDLRENDEGVGFEAYKKLGKKAFGCPSCFIADKEIIEIPEGRFKGLKWSTAAYLNAAVISAKVDIKNSGEAVKYGDVTDRYGLDQLSLSDLLDFIFTVHEDGIIDTKDVGGLPLNRGSIDTVLTWLDKITFREGFGDVLADGWQGVIKFFGEEVVKERSTLIKGREGVWDPRLSGLGTNEFAQLVYPRGPNAECGGSGLYTLGQPVKTVRRHAQRMGMPEEAIERSFDSPLQVNIGRFVTSSEHWLVLFNSLGICNRHVNNRFWDIGAISELYSAATGVERSPAELIEDADRVWNVYRMINMREGFDRKDDEPPELWFRPMKDHEGNELHAMDYYGTKRLAREDIDQWLDDYYRERGWDVKTGIPTKEKLVGVGLDDLARDLPV